jgi:hypothetical protein
MFKPVSYRTCDYDDDCRVTVRYPGAIFYILWSPSDLASAPHIQEDYMARLGELNDDDENPAVPLRKLVQPFDALMHQLAPPSKQAPFLLYDYLYPEWFQLKATGTEKSQTLQPVHMHEVDDPVCRPGWVLSGLMRGLNLSEWVPRWFSSNEIELPADGERHPLLHIPAKVVIMESRTECFFKSLGAASQGTYDELVAFRAIEDATKRGALPFDTRICRLIGLVVDTVGTVKPRPHVVGMLLTYIKPKREILSTLQYVARAADSHRHLPRWANDVEHIVGALHRAGCVWGDAKPDNVLVDSEDNVWVVDFGGGYTPGWIDEELQGTKRGDLQALEKIRQWLEGLDKPSGA